ncbi:helix-turn-helix domain-containing protein [Labrys miyagiensis]|uniref:helix-turn-helix domain-containing protein n=1 Tax=Labrys miyagiensis TaxID=346912 RepID=UPI003D66B3F7
MKPPPFSPEMLAERWGCTPNHVRTLIKTGRLRAFSVGTRIFRVPEDAVEEFEKGEFTQPAKPSAPQQDVAVVTVTPAAARLLRRTRRGVKDAP